MKTNIVLVVIGLMMLCAAASAAAVTVSVDSTTVGAGSKATIPVNIKGANSLGAMDFIVTYDSVVLTFSKGELGEASPNGMVSFNDKNPGSVKVSLADSKGISSDGALVKLTFDVTGAKGTKTAMGVNVIGAWNEDLTDVQTTTQGGTVTVGDVKKAPVSAVMVLLGVLVAGMVVMYRRSRNH